jgi:transposase
MEQLCARCAGLDVHKETVVACMRIGERGKVVTEVRTFPTTTIGLLALADWLEGQQCTDVAMEATGVYWKPVWHVLEERFQLLLANPAHIKNVPGRKTDVKDAEWIAGLLAHGLIQASFVPPTPIQAIRDLTRTRKQLTHDQSRQVLRIHKVLEDANIKLTSVLTDVMGVTGRQILDAIVSGTQDPAELVKFRNVRCKASKQAFVDALTGFVSSHHRFLLRMHLDQVDSIQAVIKKLDAELTAHLSPFRAAQDLLMTIPGFGEVSARAVISEIGVDMSRFPTDAHLRSWGCLCPRNDESAGKRRSTRTRKGAQWFRPNMMQVAWCAVRTKGSYFQAQFGRLKSRIGTKKAIVAVAASLTTVVYHVLQRGEPYRETGSKYFNQMDTARALRKLTRRIESLGYSVALEPLPEAS